MGVHDGHRRRMRERFRREGLDGFADHEVLELVLFDCIPNGNVNPLAHELLDTFGSLHGVLEARMDQLLAVKGVGERTAAHLATLLPLFRRYQQSVCADRKKIQNRSQASAYCLALLSGWRIERFYLLSLNADMELMGTRLIAEGSLTEVSAYPRLVVEAALNHNAHSVVFCHQPSRRFPASLGGRYPDHAASAQHPGAHGHRRAGPLHRGGRAGIQHDAAGGPEPRGAAHPPSRKRPYPGGGGQLRQAASPPEKTNESHIGGIRYHEQTAWKGTPAADAAADIAAGGNRIFPGRGGACMLAGTACTQESSPTTPLLSWGAQVEADGTLSVQLQWRLDAAYDAWEASPCLVVTCGAQRRRRTRPPRAR